MKTNEKIENESELMDKLITNYGPSRYKDVVWAMTWARHIRRQEEYRQLPMAEIIEKALLDVIGGKVPIKDVLAARQKDQVGIEKPVEKKEVPAKEKKEESKKTKKK